MFALLTNPILILVVMWFSMITKVWFVSDDNSNQTFVLFLNLLVFVYYIVAETDVNSDDESLLHCFCLLA